ncbi:hypothetical protein LCGC14_1486270 [marine sediment metagenome]|uniref:AB hydrolase-1 domain-containing protein n=1 Tax=marine sediment metagenome TaxID=412755 RepID=A0A0F9J8S6_9ZZZZ
MVEKHKKDYPNYGHYIHVNGLDMYYEDRGSGSPLIMIHGGTGTGFQWEIIMPILTQHFRVIVPDSRGHGRTDNPSNEFNYRLMAEDIATLIKELDLDKPLICGWSDGGQIALEVGIHYPNLSKALVVGGALSEYSESFLNSMKVIGIKGPGVIDFDQLQKVLPDFVSIRSKLHSHVYGPEYWKSLMKNISKMWLNPLAYPKETIREIATPVLIIIGDRDQAIPVEEAVKMYQLIPTAELAIVPYADHQVTRYRHELFTNIILDFLLRFSDIP